MRKPFQRLNPRRGLDRGFTLVVALLLMLLLGILAISLLGLATIELRKSAKSLADASARSNARLALMQAIGQLQKSLGPDQRVSATAEILGDAAKQPQWTGAWRSVRENGAPFLSRDDLDGGLRDARWAAKSKPADTAIGWLVSGEGDPLAASSKDALPLFTMGKQPVVSVPQITVAGRQPGHLAWWTGDLGTRANLGTLDPRKDVPVARESPENGGYFRVMASQAADMRAMAGGVDLEKSAGRLVTAETVSLAGAEADWGREHAFDFTTDSRGVLADVADGGLKSDLTVYLESGRIAAKGGLPGLADDDPLVAPGEPGGRHAIAAPRFGVLRDWARLAAPFSGKDVAETEPDFDPSVAKDSDLRALANEKPVKLAGNLKHNLQPVLVEATNFTQMSCYMEKSEPEKTFQLRQLMYPRIVLWNPYNCELNAGRFLVMIQGNGRQEMITKNRKVNATGSFQEYTEWLNFEGGRKTSFFSWGGILSSSGYNDPYMGSYYFAIPATKFAPGECLVFSPPRSKEYDGLSAYRMGSYNLNANELSCTDAPDPGKAYYVSATDIGGGEPFQPVEFRYAKTDAWSANGRSGVENQADDTRAIMKRVGRGGTISFEDFDKLPQVCVLSASLQFGAGRESRLEWSGKETMPIQLLDKANPRPAIVPNVRTREGIRMRWFEENYSNLINSGPLAGTPYLEEAVLANWNPRASYIVRSPWENVGGTLPNAGPGGGPWFFGAYTRDLFDQAVSWDEQMPVPRGGRMHGNPFGPPQEGAERYVLFDVPRAPTGVVSLGQFQHAKLSELVWQPTYAVGNSLADPRLGSDGLDRTAPKASSAKSAKLGGFDEAEMGWAADNQRSAGRDDWAANARSILGGVPNKDNLAYDLSFEVNRTLWDRYFLSTGTAAQKRKFLENPAKNPLANGRFEPIPGADADALADFHRAASQLMLDGAFNVNSTRPEAWKAMLSATRMSGMGDGTNTPFPRVLDPPGGAWKSGDATDGDAAWAGYRELTPAEIARLADAIVAEVKARGPFVSLADFVNRRLANDETGRKGALQAAIDKAGLNQDFIADYPLDNEQSLPDYAHPDHLPDATRIEQTLKPASVAWGAPGFLTQADVLQSLGPALAARSDTFVIRAYGDATELGGKIVARAWCEAVVHRTPEPLTPEDSGLNSKLAGEPGDFGRRFIVTSFRWLSPDEI